MDEIKASETKRMFPLSGPMSMLEDGINSSRGSMRNTVGGGRFTCDKLACESRSFILHMTQMWVNITCLYPICQFPQTKKQM